jgi:hypothetical protein
MWAVAPRMPQVVGAAILTTVGVTVGAGIGGAILTYAVGYVATTLVTSWAVKALSPKPSSPADSMSSQGTLVNAREAAAPHDYIYGTVRKGGTITYLESTGANNNYLHMILTLAGHEVNAIGDIYIDDQIATLDGSGYVTSQSWASKIRIVKYTGSQTAAPALLLAESNQIDSNFVGNGIAYLYIRLEFDQDVFPNGIPLFTAVVQGKKVYDPRTSTTGFSANAALCMRDYLTDARGLGDAALNDTTFSASANVCDENVTLAAGGTEKRYTMNGVISADQAPGDILQQMMTCCAGTAFWGQGKWQLKVGYYTPAVKTLTLDDLRGPIQLQTRQSMGSIFNSVTGTFNDASQGYITVDYPKLTSATFLAEDGSVDSPIDLPLPFTTSAASAQRISKLTLYRGREQMTLSAEFGMAGFEVQVGDIVAFTNDRYGWTAKEFEVIGWRFYANQDAGDLRVNLELRETSEAAFDWTAEESAIISNNTNLPSAYFVETVGVSISAELRLVNQQVVGALLIALTSSSEQADGYEVQYRKYGETAWISLGMSASNNFEAIGVSDVAFDVRARAINAIGVRGDWTTISNYYITLFAALPQDVENFSANVVGNTLHLTWTPSPDLDLSHYKIRYARATLGASYQNAVDVVEKVSRPANSVVIPSQTGTYFIKAVDKLGNLSANSTSIVVVTNVSDIDALNVVETRQQDPSFTGTKSSVVVTSDSYGPYLTLETLTLFDSGLGNFDDLLGSFDGGGGSVATSGIYYFDNYVDLGAKYVSRVKTNIDVDFLDYVNMFDDAGGLFEERSGLFDGDPSQFDTVSVRTQMSYTDDNPSGSPVWSDWRDFIVGDIAARAVKFRAVLTSEAAGGSFAGATTAPAVRLLSAIVDMPDRVESASDITYTGTYAVTFPAAFKVTPAIGIATSLANGDRYAISGKSRTGFTITTYTGASVSTNPATFDYVAKGYGKGLT